jgi:hypothetical protein
MVASRSFNSIVAINGDKPCYRSHADCIDNPLILMRPIVLHGHFVERACPMGVSKRGTEWLAQIYGTIQWDGGGKTCLVMTCVPLTPDMRWRGPALLG